MEVHVVTLIISYLQSGTEASHYYSIESSLPHIVHAVTKNVLNCLNSIFFSSLSMNVLFYSCAAAGQSFSISHIVVTLFEPCHEKTNILHMRKHIPEPYHMISAFFFFFCYTKSTISLLLVNSKILSCQPASVAVQPGLFRTCSETMLMVFS